MSYPEHLIKVNKIGSTTRSKYLLIYANIAPTKQKQPTEKGKVLVDAIYYNTGCKIKSSKSRIRIVANSHRLFRFNKLTLLTTLFTLLGFAPSFFGEATLAFPSCHDITASQFICRSSVRHFIWKLRFVNHGKVFKFIIILIGIAFFG